MTGRPPVSVVVPFRGSSAGLARLLATLSTLHTADGDELIVADNRPRAGDAAATELGHARTRIVSAHGIPTPAFARNRGASAAGTAWLVFIDADTEPNPDLLDAYFDPLPVGDTAVLAGAVSDLAPTGTIAARYQLARRHMSQQATLGRGAWSYPQTANCAVRRSAFEGAGGFAAEARAGEDADLWFRLRQQGWGLEERPRAGVGHAARTSIPSLLGQFATHGSGTAWCERRHPGAFPAERPARLARRLAHDVREGARYAVRGEVTEAEFALLDAAGAAAFALGRLLPNERPRRFSRSRVG